LLVVRTTLQAGNSNKIPGLRPSPKKKEKDRSIDTGKGGRGQWVVKRTIKSSKKTEKKIQGTDKRNPKDGSGEKETSVKNKEKDI